MIRHIFTMMWNRKKSNSLILLELIVTFLVMFSLIALLIYNFRLFNLPIGFTANDNWTITIDTDEPLDSNVFTGLREYTEPTAIINIRDEAMQVLRQINGVKALHTINSLPFTTGGLTTGAYRNGQTEFVGVMLVSEGMPADIGMKLIEGNWFSQEDTGQDWRSAVISKSLRDSLFGNEPVLGEEITSTPSSNANLRRYRVVGVFDQFRKEGEFAEPRHYMFLRDPLIGERAAFNLLSSFSLLMITEGVNSGEFEQQLYTNLSALQSSLPIVRFSINPWERLQREHYIENVSPIIAMGIVVAFMIMLVGFGLFGVLWQNVIQRTREMGVRRALGATGSSVRKQITLEMVVLGLFAVAIGFVIVVQLPISGYVEALEWSLFWSSLVVSSISLLCLCAVCSLYPSWSATKVDPVEALHYE